MMKINGVEITAKQFAYDGCHKIYLIENQKEVDEAKGYGYKIFSIDRIADAFENSCPLRFIETWTDFKQIVRQFEKSVDIEWEGGKYSYIAEDEEEEA